MVIAAFFETHETNLGYITSSVFVYNPESVGQLRTTASPGFFICPGLHLVSDRNRWGLGSFSDDEHLAELGFSHVVQFNPGGSDCLSILS